MNETDEALRTFIIYAVMIAIAVKCYFMAKNKNRNAWGWALLGLAFNIFAMIALYFLPKKDPLKL